MLATMYRTLLAHYKLRSDPVRFARSLGVTIGNGCDIVKPQMAMFGTEPYLIRIGDDVTISFDVVFINHDGAVRIFRKDHPDVDVMGRISVGNNVFIGARATILGGVNIGDNAVIGAGSIVTRDVPPGVVVAGVPARKIKTIEEYWHGLQDRTVPTKRLSRDLKRDYLEKNVPQLRSWTAHSDAH